MTNAELIKALRCCIVDFNSTQSRRCNECPYGIYADGKKYCENKAKRDAAAALKAAEKWIAELSLDNKMLKNTIDADKGVMLDRIRFLEARLPKEGEWIREESGNLFSNYYCSNCGSYAEGQITMCGWNYCPNCGAKMRKGDK